MNLWWSKDTYIPTLICWCITIVISILIILLYKINKWKNFLTPCKVICVLLIVGEVIKQIALATTKPINPILLPFSISSLMLYTLIALCFSKPNSFVFRIAYPLMCGLMILLILFMLISSDSIMKINLVNENYYNFWGVFFHFALIIVGLILLVFRPWPIAWKDVLYASLTFLVWAIFQGCATWVLNANFDQFMHIKEWWFTIVVILGLTICMGGLITLAKVTNKYRLQYK